MDEALKVWEIRWNSNECRSFMAKNWSGNEWHQLLLKFKEGRPMLKDWKPVELIVFEGDNAREAKKIKKQPIPDFAKGVVTTCISEKARAALEPLIADQVEFLPVATPAGPYYEMNIRRIEGLDVPRSQVIIEETGGDIIDVERYALRWERLQGKHLFLLQETGIFPQFVSEEFRLKYEENGLTGLKFVPLPM